jgi:predicted small secreted protein
MAQHLLIDHVKAVDLCGGLPDFSDRTKGTIMIAKFTLLLAALSLASIPLTACNTVAGAGKDVEKAGAKVQEEAQEHKTY